MEERGGRVKKFNQSMRLLCLRCQIDPPNEADRVRTAHDPPVGCGTAVAGRNQWTNVKWDPAAVRNGNKTVHSPAEDFVIQLFATGQNERTEGGAAVQSIRLRMLVPAAKAVKLSAGIERFVLAARRRRSAWPANKTFDTADKIVEKNQTMQRRWQQQQQRQHKRPPLSAPGRNRWA